MGVAGFFGSRTPDFILPAAAVSDRSRTMQPDARRFIDLATRPLEDEPELRQAAEAELVMGQLRLPSASQAPMARAARRPAPMARITVAAPVTMSPPA